MKVYITYQLPEIAENILKEHFEVEVNRGRHLTKGELIEKIKDADGVLCLLNNKIDAEVLDRAKNVKIFANYAVGYNNIDVNEANKRGVIVTNTPDVLTDATADLAFSLLLAVSRRIVEADKFTREGKFTGWEPNLFLGLDLKEKTLGIIGAGRIGKALAKRSIGFDMKIMYFNRKRYYDFEKEFNAEYVDKETLLKESDFISLHAPLTDETYHIIGEKELQIMKQSAVLINTARGSLIDEKALVAALKNKKIFGAGLDVYEYEPKIEEELKTLENVIILPHIGSATIYTRNEMARLAAENIKRVLKGEEPLTPVRL